MVMELIVRYSRRAAGKTFIVSRKNSFLNLKREALKKMRVGKVHNCAQITE